MSESITFSADSHTLRSGSNSRSRRRLWGFRAAAVLLGISLFFIAEGACRVFDWGAPANFDDPYVGFTAVHPLFVKNDAGDRYEIAKSRLKYFARDSFPVVKSPNAFRIFCVGGSTVQGRPYSIETSFPTWMKLGLSAANPDRDWEVINCGGISYASYRLVPIVEECLQYEPDLIILCEGHNEFLEDRTYVSLKHSSPIVTAFREVAGSSRLLTLARTALRPDNDTSATKRFVMPEDADALLNYRNGLRAYHRDPAWAAGVTEHFELNLRRMVDICRKRGVPVLLVLPTSNLADCPPFKSQHADGLSPEQFDEWNMLREEAHIACRENVPLAARLYEQMLAIDPEYAATYYQLGKVRETLGEFAQAREAFVRARDLDICPLRMTSALEERMRCVAADLKVSLLDAHQLLEQRSRHGILGGPLLCDRVHPSFEGHQMIADALIDQMAGAGFVKLPTSWEKAAHQAYQAHFKSLEDSYFLKGRRTLETVEKWTQGEADGPPIETRAPHRIAPGE